MRINLIHKKPNIKNSKSIEKFFIKKGLKSLIDLSKKKTFNKQHD